MEKSKKTKEKFAPNRLKAVLKEQGRSQTWLAEQMGRHWQTVSRWVNAHTDMKWSEAIEIARVLGVDPISILVETAPLRRVRVCGSLRAGHWGASFEWPPGQFYEVGIPDRPEYAAMTLYGAEVSGESMNLIFPNGAVVIIERRTFGRTDLAPGARYHVEIQRADGSVENTLKKVKASNDGRLWLIPESDDPEFQTPIRVDAAGGEHVSIVGRVVGSFLVERGAI